MTNDETKQKRNKPCESCRAHRRKCIVLEGDQCERCLKMELPCIFKFTEKPTAAKKSIPIARKNKMLEQVRSLEAEMASLEVQLQSMNVAIQLQPRSLPLPPTPSSSSSTSTSILATVQNEVGKDTTDEWQLSIRRRGNAGLELQTSIKNVSDVVLFLNKALKGLAISDSSATSTWTDTPCRTPMFYTDKTEQSLKVTFKLLHVENVLRSLFRRHKTSRDPIRPISDASAPETWAVAAQHTFDMQTTIRLALIDNFFICYGLANPILVRSHYWPLLREDPHSMLASAITAFVAYSQCRHVSKDYFPTAAHREAQAERLRQEARAQLEDVIFEQEPSVDMVAALLMMTNTSLILLRNKEARTYIGIAWRMVLDLKNRYLDILVQFNTPPSTFSATPPSIPPTDLAIAESWRRVFYLVRYLELNVCMIFETPFEHSSILFYDVLGYPTVLECEKADLSLSRAVTVFHHVMRLGDCQMATKADAIGYRLFAGSLDSISLCDVEDIESRMFAFWQSLPSEFRLSDSPMDYVQLDRIQQCDDVRILYLNELYYVNWVAFATRIMQRPSTTDLVGATFSRVDGNRALLIVSICCDAVAKIFKVLFYRLPCLVELHWLLFASDAMAMLKETASARIRELANENLRSTLRILKRQMQGDYHRNKDEEYEDYDETRSMDWQQHTPPSTLTSSSSSASASPPPDHDMARLRHTSPSAESTLTNTSDEEVMPMMGTTNHPLMAAYFDELKKALESYFAGYGYANI